MSTLENIQTKIRRLTGRPSAQQISDDQLNEYINTFYLYDMPETLRLFSQETVFEFMTEANVAQYDLRDLLVWNGSINERAIDLYNSLEPPAYVAGYLTYWSQDREQFFITYPALSDISNTLEGDGISTTYTFTFANTPILQNKVTVGAIDNTNTVVNAIDVPTDRTNGTWKQINTNVTVTGSVNYLTGAMSVTFPNPIPVGNQITFTSVPYVASRPQGMLFFHNVLTMRPVPDKSYLVRINAFKIPTQMIAAGNPELKQWWQFLSYGAARKIFQDSQDPEGEAAIIPAFKEQERLVLRRTIVQLSNQRVQTIYNDTSQQGIGNFQNRL